MKRIECLCLYTFILFLASSFSPLLAQKGLHAIFETYDDLEEHHHSGQSYSWPDLSEEKRLLILNGYKRISSSLQMIDTDSLSNTDLISLEMLSYLLEDKIYRLEYGSYLMPLNSEGGFITSMIYGSQSTRLKTEESISNYLRKLEDFPRYIRAQLELLDRGIKEGKTRPKLVVDNCLLILEDLLNEPKDSFFLLRPLNEISYHCSSDLIDDTYASFTELHTYLKSKYYQAARDEIGISANRDGESFYRQRVGFYTSLDMSPKEVFETGLSEVARIRAEMQEILDKLAFEGSLSDFIKFLREDEQFYAKTPEELLYYAAWLSKKAEEILPKYFNKLPRLPFTVSPVPEAIAPNYTAGRYSGGSMSSQRAGSYLVNTYKLESRPMYLLPALTLHEAVPGHHLQGSLAKELKDLPSFRSSYLSAFGEGWGLYSEFLGKEAGMYKGAYEDFGRLSYEMWRACRLVIDPGIHVYSWTREQAVEFMRENTSLSFHEIETEINRYIGWPGQAVSYKIGELKIRELRKAAEEKLGDEFDIREFHDLILSNGSVPLKSIERIVDQYIMQKINDE